MPKWAFSPAQLAEASLVVRTVLFGVRLALDGVTEDTSILLVTLAVLDEEGANWHLLWVKSVQVSALFSLLASIPVPVNADFRLYLALISFLDESGSVLLDLIKGEFRQVLSVIDRAALIV